MAASLFSRALVRGRGSQFMASFDEIFGTEDFKILDGDLDLAFANDNDPNTVWLNDGTGTFTDTGSTLDSNRTEGIALGDLDGDADLDIAFANNGSGNTIGLNDGVVTGKVARGC